MEVKDLDGLDVETVAAIIKREVEADKAKTDEYVDKVDHLEVPVIINGTKVIYVSNDNKIRVGKVVGYVITDIEPKHRTSSHRNAYFIEYKNGCVGEVSVAKVFLTVEEAKKSLFHEIELEMES